jgi:8-oxo-dGTP diphosphatase
MMKKKDKKSQFNNTSPSHSEEVLKNDLDKFPKPSVTVDCVIFGYDMQSLQILLLNRKEKPFKNKWTIPGGFLYIDETLKQAAERVLVTKTGLSDIFLEQLFTFGDLERDPRGRVLSVAYFALVNPKKFKLVKGDAANEVAWFDLDALPELGFDHSKIFEVAHQRLQGKIRYQPIGFELLDEHFTLPELQQIYETILKVALDRGNFRKKMLSLGIIKATGEKRNIGGHRAPDLYVFDKEKYDELLRDGIKVGLDF